jgi:hypothetical protein
MIDFKKIITLNNGGAYEAFGISETEANEVIELIIQAHKKYVESGEDNSLVVLTHLPPLSTNVALFAMMVWAMNRSEAKERAKAESKVAMKLIKLVMELAPGNVRTGEINSKDCNTEKCKNCEAFGFCPIKDKIQEQENPITNQILFDLMNRKKGEA